MPRNPKRPVNHRTADLITGSEVDAMFRKATSEPPWPDLDACEVIADVLTKNNIGLGMISPETKKLQKDVIAATETLERFINSQRMYDERDPSISYLDIDLANLEAALKKSKGALQWGPATVNPQWGPVSITIASVAAWALQNIGRTAGRARDSVLVKFVSLVLERMGYVGATPAAIEALFQKWNYRPGTLQNT
jgi:hypothetical protein